MLRPLLQLLCSVQPRADRVFARIFCSSFAPLAYVCTIPIAELYFYFLSRRFLKEQQAAPHRTFAGKIDAAEFRSYVTRLGYTAHAKVWRLSSAPPSPSHPLAFICVPILITRAARRTPRPWTPSHPLYRIY